MLFTSREFFVLLLATLIGYYLPGLGRFQVPILVIASAVFYSFLQPFLLALLLLSAAINIVTLYGLESVAPRRRRTIAAAGVVAHLSLLGFFKYSPLFAATFLSASSSVSAFLLAVPLPIGISFFTFHGISLLIDTYRDPGTLRGNAGAERGRGEAARDILHYITFLPQLVAGPIVKARDFLPQIGVKRWEDIDWEQCAKYIILGYFFKMVVADNLAQNTFWMSHPYFLDLSSVDLLVMLLAFSFQIFADFQGYSLIAIGLAALFGYRLPENFNFPYLATSISDFWRRWHISLSSFLKDYLYVALGGNRKGEVRTYINLMVVMLLGGLWHGAAWSYMVWGGLHGALLAGERLLVRLTPRFVDLVPTAARIAIVFCLVSLAWLLFKLPDFSHALAYLQLLAISPNPQSLLDESHFMLLYSTPVVAYHAYHAYARDSARSDLKSQRWEPVGYGFMLFLIITNSGPPVPFVYFQF